MLNRSDFPNSFVFGAATSAYQIEGHSFGGAGQTHWDQFAHVPGNVVNGENGSIACDHYHRYQEDLDFLIGFDAYRFSTSWARVLPEGRGTANQAGLDFYDRLVDAVLERGLQPFLTLYHWELPAALSDLGGWSNRDIAGWFGDYTDIVIARLGDRLASVATINEPWCVAYLSHHLGHHAPGKIDLAAAACSMHNVLLAHGESLQRMRASGQENLGIVLNFEHVQPEDSTPDNVTATNSYDAILNQWFVQALTKGSYPQAALSGFIQHMPDGWQDDMEMISKPLDWLGVNYYTRQIIAADPGAPWPSNKSVSGPLNKTQMSWEIYPEGLYKVLARLKNEYTNDLPLYVTENGMAWNDQVIGLDVNDPERLDYFDQHLRAVHRALNDGVNIQGYFFWSLLDNFEWAYGYDKRFGLIHVDFKTQVRTPKMSYRMLKKAFGRETIND